MMGALSKLTEDLECWNFAGVHLSPFVSLIPLSSQS